MPGLILVLAELRVEKGGGLSGFLKKLNQLSLGVFPVWVALPFLIDSRAVYLLLFYGLGLPFVLTNWRGFVLPTLKSLASSVLGVALLSFVLLSAVVSLRFPGSFSQFGGYWKEITLFFAFLMWASCYFGRKGAPRQFERWYCRLMVVSALISLAIYVYHYRPGFRAEPFSLESNSQVCSAAAGLAALYAFGLFLDEAKTRFRWWWFAAFLVTALATFLSFTKGPIMALTVAMGFVFFMKLKRVYAILLGVLSAVVVLLFVNIVTDAIPVVNEWISNIEFFAKLVKRGASKRDMVWAASLGHIFARPWTGYGPYLLPKIPYSHPHNLFLAQTVFYGISGLFALLVCFLSAYWRAFFCRRWVLALAVCLYVSVINLAYGSYLIENPYGMSIIQFWVPFVWLWAVTSQSRGRTGQ